MRDQKSSLHAVPIVPNPNVAPGDVWFSPPPIQPRFDDLIRGLPPIPTQRPVPEQLKDSPWLPNYRNEVPGTRSPEAAGGFDQRLGSLAPSPLLAVLAALRYPSRRSTALSAPPSLIEPGYIDWMDGGQDTVGDGDISSFAAAATDVKPDQPAPQPWVPGQASRVRYLSARLRY